MVHWLSVPASARREVAARVWLGPDLLNATASGRRIALPRETLMEDGCGLSQKRSEARKDIDRTELRFVEH